MQRPFYPRIWVQFPSKKLLIPCKILIDLKRVPARIHWEISKGTLVKSSKRPVSLIVELINDIDTVEGANPSRGTNFVVDKERGYC